MSQLEQITIKPGLSFDALTSGVSGAPLVLLLHGFAESMNCWRAQVAALTAKGFRAIAPSQRGYSPGARPDVNEAANYHIDHLMNDAMAMVDACGYGDQRFHLVAAVHEAVVCIPTPWEVRVRPSHPEVESVMQEGRQHRLGAGRSSSATHRLARGIVAAAS
jgi:hypothetical protein